MHYSSDTKVKVAFAIRMGSNSRNR